MIRVLIVDDSPTTLAFLVEVLGRDPGIDVVGSARDGIEGVKLAARLHPDVIVMDVNMPGMDGYQACRLIMEENPAPIIVQSSTVSLEDTANSFRALQAGAVATLLKPTGPADPRREDLCRRLVRTVKAMAEVKVVRRHMRHRQGGGAAWVPETVGDGRPNLRRGRIEIAALGASTGGPQVLHEILGALQGKCPVPVLVTQHISPGFLEGMLEWLGRETGLPLRIAGHGDVVQRGTFYFAPDGLHMGVAPGGRILLHGGPPENGVRPSVSHLFRSVAASYGSRALAVLLTGMGRDGASEIHLVRNQGGLAVVQDETSCVVNGMPAEARRLGLSTTSWRPWRSPHFFRQSSENGPKARAR